MHPVDGDSVAGDHGLRGGAAHQGDLCQYPLHASSAQMVLGALSEPELGEEPGSGTVIREPERFS